MIDKDSKEWKEYCEGLLNFDSHFETGVMAIPSNPNGPKVDMPALIKYVEEKYNGDISKVTEAEKQMFIILVNLNKSIDI